MDTRFRDYFRDQERISPAIFILLFLLIIAFCCALVWGMLSTGGENIYEESLYASTQANYFADSEYVIPNIDPNIIWDVILDVDPSATVEIEDRMATLDTQLLTPVPTMTLSFEEQLTATATFLTNIPPSITASPSLAPTPLPSQTPSPTKIATVIVPKPPSPGIAVVKRLASYDDNDASNTISLGDDLWYQFTVYNTGDTLLSLMMVKELTFAIPVSCPVTILASGTSMTCIAMNAHQVTLAEANAGKVVNWAYASGDYGGIRYSDTDDITTPIQQSPAIEIAKELQSYDDNDLSGDLSLGDGLWYRFAITNTGDVTLGSISVSDNTFGIPVSCSASSLIPGSSMTCATTAAHIITAGEISAGEIANTATVSADINGVSVTDSDTLITPLSITLEKTVASYDDNDTSGSITFGDDLWYQFDVSNIGTMTLNSLAVTDDSFGLGVTCPVTTLASGASTVCSATIAYSVTLADADAGLVQNIASVTANPPSGPGVSDSDTLDTTIAQDAELTLVKSASTATYDTVGQVITYSFDVENTGNVTILGLITVDDDLTSDESCPAGDLVPTASMTCTASYAITQADLDSGSVANTASATGAGPGGASVSSAPDTVTISAVQNPQIQITKNVTSYADNDSSNSITQGDNLWYQFVLSNSGNVTLSSIAVNDDTFGISVTCPVSSLAPGASTTCLADAAHTISVAEADAGQVINNATASGYLGALPATDTDSVTTAVTQNPAIQLTNGLQGYSDNDISGSITYNDALTYEFTLTNSGNVTLGSLAVTDDTFGISITCPVSSLAPGVSATCTADAAHTVSLAEADAGQVSNSATASSVFSLTPYTASDSLVTTVQQNPALTLTKSADLASFNVIGQTITYTYTLENSGNVTLSGDFSINDDLIGTIDPCGTGPLVPGATTSCTAIYSTTQYDLDFGSVTNTASGHTTYDSSPFSSNTDTVTVPAVQNPAYTIIKSVTDVGGDGAGGHADEAGDVLSYQIVLLNTGNASLVGVDVSDPLLGLLTGPTESGTADEILGVTETWTYIGSYTLLQTDIEDNGGGDGDIDNTASATTTFLTTPQTSSVAVPVDQNPELSLTKSADVMTYDAVGQVITYTYTIENTGNITLAGPFTIDDDKQGTLTDCATGSLQPSATTTCTDTHAITQADLDAGSITNVATVTGNSITSTPDSVTVNADQSPELTLIKSADLASYDTVGQVITYTFDVENTGNVTISGQITVDDDQTTDESCPAGDLAPGASIGCSASYTITQTDLNAGSVTNSASASGTAPDASTVTSATDSITVNATQTASIQMTKSLASYDDNDSSNTITRDDSLWYQFVVSNDGNVTLGSVGVTDDSFAIPVTCPSSTLAPAASMTCTADTSHMITLLEAGASQVSNTATASSDFDGTPYSISDTLITVVIPPNIPSSISGQVRDDTDGDGDLNDGEAGLANVTIELYNGTCTLGSNCPSTTTDLNGIFSFTSIPDGGYTLVETDLAQYLSTADSDPPNDNQIDVVVSNEISSSNNVFLDHVEVSTCVAPNPVTGFVASSVPADGESGVSMGTTTLAITFTSPMLTSGDGSVLDKGSFDNNIDNETLGGDVPILDVNFDASTNTAYLTINTDDAQWQPGSEFRIRIKSGIRNACETKQDVDVDIFFTTETVISGQVINNEDGKGIYGVDIELTGGSCGASCGTVSTDLDGNFEFFGFAPGSYTLEETDLAGFSSIGDSDGANDNLISFTVLADTNSTGHSFVDAPLTCAAPTITGSNPADGATNISLGTTTVTVTFDQPMITYGGGSVLDIGSFDDQLKKVGGGDVPLLDVSYDPDTLTATLTIDASNANWLPGSTYELKIKHGTENSCGTDMGSDVIVTFSTEAYISGQVRNSLDGEGIYGALVELTGGSCAGTCDSATTDINGEFTFVGFDPDTYTLVETDLPGFISDSDSNGINDNLVPLTLLAGSNSLGHFFIDTPNCSAPDPVTGFIVSSDPADSQVGFPFGDNTLEITFNQPMLTSGGGSIFSIGNFDNDIDRQIFGGDVPILDVGYDPNTYTATLTIDTSDPQWLPGSEYRIKVKDNLENACGTKGVNTEILFTTNLVISGQVRQDTDDDGNLGDPDKGIPGVTVRLYNSTETALLDTTITNASGYFSFTALTPGTYVIREIDPDDYDSTADSDGVNDNRITVTVSAGAHSFGHKFLDAPD